MTDNELIEIFLRGTSNITNTLERIENFKVLNEETRVAILLFGNVVNAALLEQNKALIEYLKANNDDLITITDVMSDTAGKVSGVDEKTNEIAKQILEL